MKKTHIGTLILSAFTLGACDNSTGSNQTNNTPSNNGVYSKTNITVPLSSQLRTPTSANFTSSTKNTLSTQMLNTNTESNPCFSILTTGGKPYSITTNPSQWWSTASLNFSVKNSCATEQNMKNIIVKVKGFALNGAPVTTIGDIAQSGQGPWMNVTSQVQGDNINVVLNTPDCDGDYCSWANTPANSVRNYTINTSLGSMINTATATDVTIDGDTPPPPPPPVQTGSLDIKIDSSKLIDVCKATSCNIKINVLDPSHQISQSVQINPVESSLYEVDYSGLLPGNYQMTVDATTLPDGATQDFMPTSGIISVASSESATGGINFNYTVPQKTASLTLNMTSLQSEFPSISKINATLADIDTGKINNVSLPVNGGSITITNLIQGHSYQIISEGLADAYTGTYYHGIKQTQQLNNASNTLTLSLTKDTTGQHAVQFSTTGIDTQTAKLIFADNAGLNGDVYVYAQNPLINGYSYKFLNSEVATINAINTPSNYTFTITPNTITNSTTSVVVAFTKIVTTGTYDYIAPFKDYNNKIILSVQGITSAKSLEFTANFQQSSGWGSCFGQSMDNLAFNTVSLNDKFITTVNSKDGKTPLNLTQSCDIMGTNSGSSVIFPGVAVPQVYAVKLDGSSTSLPMNSPCSATGCKDPGNGYTSSGYYAQWAVWGREYNPSTMPFNNINNIIYAFIGFDPATGNIKTLDASADSWGLSAVTRAMKQYPYMKAHLSFGGWTNNGVNTAPMFEQLASNQASMDNFAEQSVAKMRQLGLTGIDIDWEWWSDYALDVAPAKKQLALFKTLRNELNKAETLDGKKYSLTIATNVSPQKINAMQAPSNTNSVSDFWAQVSKLVDNINIMSYDIHGAFDVSKPASFQATWEMNTDNPYYDQHEDIKSGIAAYKTANVPASKLVIGLPLYARTMAISSLGSKNGLYSNVTGVGFGDYENGVLDYKCLINPVFDKVNGCGSNNPIAGVKALQFIDQAHNTNQLWTTYSATTSYQPWGYSENTFVTYDDTISATLKTQAMKANGLGGMMFWELDGDSTNPSQSIVQAVKNELNK